jgi:Holliday junction DNA helicase RuvA
VIGRLTGRLARKAPQQVILDVHGVGYRVLVSLTTFYALPDEGVEVSLETYTGVREDAILLYGFWETQEKTLFEKLITVSKIGPKLALNILSGISVADLKAAIAGGDIARLTSVPGLGPKTAERVVVELRDKIAVDDEGPTRDEVVPGLPADARRAVDDAVDALLNLGYRKKEAEKAVAKAVKAGETDLEALIRQSLALLSG